MWRTTPEQLWSTEKVPQTPSFLCYRKDVQGNGDMRENKEICTAINGRLKIILLSFRYTSLLIVSLNYMRSIMTIFMTIPFLPFLLSVQVPDESSAVQFASYADRKCYQKSYQGLLSPCLGGWVGVTFYFVSYCVRKKTTGSLILCLKYTEKLLVESRSLLNIATLLMTEI